MADAKITHRHRDYDRIARYATYAWDHYSVTPVLDSIDEAAETAASGRPGVQVVHGRPEEAGGQTTITKADGTTITESRYLHMHRQAESVEGYKERCRATDLTPLFPMAVDTLSGIFFGNEGDAERVWDGGPLGDPEDGESVMGRLWDNIDGDGLNYLTLWKQLTTRLTVLMETWVLVDGIRRGANGKAVGEATVTLINPTDVTNWREEDGRVVEVVVRERVDTRQSVLVDGGVETQYVHYTLDGYQRWTRDADSGTYVPGELVPYSDDGFRYMGKDGRPILPIFRARLPLERHVGYIAARKANAHFNLESSRDWLLWVANFVRFIFDHERTGWDIDQALEWLAEGWNALPAGDHSYINPSSEPAQLASEVLKDKKRDFFESVFQTYNDAAREKTATEITMDQQDLRAFMTLLKDAIDETENAVLWRLEQVYAPAERARWGSARVTRSDDFAEVNIEELSDRLTRRYFGETVPVDTDTLVAAATRILESDDIPYDEDALRAAVASFVEERGGQAGALARRREGLLARLRGDAA